MRLEPEQEQLLVDLVESERRVTRERRSEFVVARTIGPPGVQLIHEGWVDRQRRVFEGDLETLASEGLLSCRNLGNGTPGYFVTPQGLQYFSLLMQKRGEPVERLETTIRRHLDSAVFRSRYPLALQKWMEAEALFWSEDSPRNLTTIGHLCREALQEFATSLVRLLRIPNVDTDPAKTVSRIRAVISIRRSAIGTARGDFLDALLAYWGTVSDLTQRQEHGGQKEGVPLNTRDARRVLFQTMIVMYEVDDAIQ